MEYDIIIVGGGPAGLSAAVYCTRYGLKSAVISKTRGGTAATAHSVCNFPTYISIKGFELMQRFIEQVENIKIPIFYEEVLEINRKNDLFYVKTDGKNEYKAKKIIFCAGTKRARLDVPNEGKFLGKGLSYCATCDGPFFKNKKVVVIGGSDAALTSALLLADIASEVSIIYRKDKFMRAEHSWIELVNKNSKIKKIFNEEVIEILGKDKVEEIKLKSGKKMKIDGVFVEIGSIPATEFLKSLKLKLNEKGYVMVDREQKTNIPGLFAAGDVTDNILKQIITASGEGAVAAFSAFKELKNE